MGARHVLRADRLLARGRQGRRRVPVGGTGRLRRPGVGRHRDRHRMVGTYQGRGGPVTPIHAPEGAESITEAELAAYYEQRGDVLDPKAAASAAFGVIEIGRANV